MSSSDEHSALPSPTTAQPSNPIPSRSLAYGSSALSPGSVSHRRHTINRPNLHASASNVTLDSLAPLSTTTVGSTGPNPILNGGEMTSSPAGTSVQFGQPPPYPEATASSSYTVYPRVRRKSLSHVSTAVPRVSEETSPDEVYQLNGLNGLGLSHSKGKKKRTRTASFSLPFHRRRRLSSAGWSKWWRILRSPQARRQYVNRWGCLSFLFVLALLLFLFWKSFYEIQVEFSVFSHHWVRHEVDTVRPLRGCFGSPHLSPLYDLERHKAPNRQLLSPGVSLKRGTTCYDFSATVQALPDAPLEPLIYHTYWRADLIPFGERHTATLLAFLATQPLTHSKLILWTNGVDVVANNTFVKPFLDKWGNYIEVRQLNMNTLTRGTELEGLLSGNDGGGLFDERAWVDGDAVRLLVLWNFGGIWMDMDQVLTRDLHPLTDQEFVTQWDCYGGYYLIPRAPSYKSADAVFRLYRQAILLVEWRVDAFPTTLAIPLRSIPHHGFVPTPSTQYVHMGFTPVFETSSTATRESRQTICRLALVFCRST